jgi:UDP-N-acetylmuramoylalanine--D-glutamate ligase
MIEGKNITVVGLGVSGYEAALLAQRKGAVVKVTDSGDYEELRGRAAELDSIGVTSEIGGHSTEFLEGTEILVVSPGVENSSIPIKWAEEKGIPIISEIELAYKFCRSRIVAISGTNGKSTVASIIGEMVEKSGLKACVCGNIGTPFAKVVTEAGPEAIIVLEISSFQLERIDAFRPHIAVMLNITEDHLDRYANFDEYADAKMALFKNQDETDYAILNYDQQKLARRRDSIRSRVLFFSKHRLSKEFTGAYVENEELVVRRDGKFVWISNKESLSLKGEHNLENALAAGLAAFLAGAGAEAIDGVLQGFSALHHRFEAVDTINGVKFVDDSKATNVDSVYRAIQSTPKWIVLIAGGRDKGGGYKAMSKVVRDKVRSILLIGEARDRIARELSGTVPISFADTLDDAVKKAFETSKRGDTVLLSPMCSSFDMFKDYKERGEAFRKAVKALK